MSLQTLSICLLLTSLLGLERANAQHSDVLLQNVEDRLTSGDSDLISGVSVLGARSFTQVFNSTFAVTDPGWNALGVGAPNLPADAQPLPTNSNIAWDFLPMKINDRLSNLFYWNETGDVQFGETPSAGYEFAMQSKSSGFISVAGSSDLVAGATIDNTDSIGSLHRHRFFFLALNLPIFASVFVYA